MQHGNMHAQYSMPTSFVHFVNDAKIYNVHYVNGFIFEQQARLAEQLDVVCSSR